MAAPRYMLDTNMASYIWNLACHAGGQWHAARQSYMQIAAHALAMGAILVTNDQAFARVPALALENWVSL